MRGVLIRPEPVIEGAITKGTKGTKSSKEEEGDGFEQGRRGTMVIDRSRARTARVAPNRECDSGHASTSRASLAKCVGFLLGGIFFAWNLLVVYAFSSMVDPALPRGQRNAEIVRRFLLGDGIHHVFLVIGLCAAAVICFASAGTNIWAVATGRSGRASKLAISTGALALSLLAFATVYFVFS